MISLDSRTRSKLAWIATMFAPIAVVQGVRMLADATPAPAAAATVTGTPATVVANLPITDRQRDALRWLMDRGGRLPTRSPMDRPLPAPVPVQASQDKPPVEQAPAPRADDSPKNVRVTSIIGEGTRGQMPLATINHRVRRVGEEIAPGWKVVKIDSRARVVVVRHSDGRELRYEPVNENGQ